MQKGTCQSTETALHTHDSICFKRCRRKWFFSSAFSKHLQPKASIHGVNPNLWFGSGFHWAMEDYYGERKFKTPRESFEVYCQSFEPEELPDDFESLLTIGQSMLDYYEEWEEQKGTWRRVWLNGKPLVEVAFSLVLDPLCYYELEGDRYFALSDIQAHQTVGCLLYKGAITGDIYTASELQALGADYHEIVFHGKLDAIVMDDQGDWWVLDYKTAKSFDTAKLALDPQISKYCWAAEQYLNHEIAGMIYVQVSKNPPGPPKLTTKGISSDKRQRTTYTMYQEALIDYYGTVENAPKANLEFLALLAEEETENGNKFVRVDWVPRSEDMRRQTYENIINEGLDMLSPNLRIYPNPTKDCSWDCPFKDMCVAMEERLDWTCYLDEFEVRNETMKDEVPKWQIKMYRNWPDKFPDEFKKYCTDTTDSVEEFCKQCRED